MAPDILMAAFLLVVLALVGVAALVLLWRAGAGVRGLDARLSAIEQATARGERWLGDELARGRREQAETSGALRREVMASLDAQGGTLRGSVVELGGLLEQRLGQVEAGVATLVARVDERIGTLTARTDERLGALSSANEQRLDEVRRTLDTRLDQLQRESGARLDEMRAVVDEKLQATLERRLGESFRQVSDRLEQVHRGLGEMQTLAAGVGDLRKVLSNVKARGTWGEVQLRALLEQGLAPEQFAENVATREGSNERVEFVVKLPGRDEEAPALLLPIDAKFPLEDYQRLVEAAEAGDVAASEAAGLALDARVRQAARDIREKYVNPPRTTDFAILFLPTEGLYAEVLRRPGLGDRLQREHRVVVAGPTTLWAFITSLQMGFRTLAIERRSSEVWELLGRVKAEFARFGDTLGAVQRKLQEASNRLDEAQRGTRRIQKSLGGVEELALPEAAPDRARPPLLESLEGE